MKIRLGLNVNEFPSVGRALFETFDADPRDDDAIEAPTCSLLGEKRFRVRDGATTLRWPGVCGNNFWRIRGRLRSVAWEVELRSFI